MIRSLFLVGALLVASVVSGIFPRSTVTMLPDGTLIRVETEVRVYYLDEGKRRWIDSAETFYAHGFSWDDVLLVTVQHLDTYEDGEALTAQSRVVLPGEAERLPDLIPFPAQELRLSKRDNRTVLRFSAIFWNQGGGALELLADPKNVGISGDAVEGVFQRIRRASGAERWKLAGNFFWHAAHGHYHFGDVMDYSLEPVAGMLKTATVKEKVTFCLRDDRAVDLNLAQAPSTKVFSSCGKSGQGVSVGWADVYRYTLPEQYLDVHDLSAGEYYLWFDLNPRQQLLEGRTDNNRSFVLFELDPAKDVLTVVAGGAPFFGSSSYRDGFLIRAEGDDKLYVMFRNKKRWLRTKVPSEGVTIHVLPRSIVDVIPLNNLIRADETTVYAINDAGYKRAILSAEVFNAYGFRWDDVADTSEVELATYPDSNLIQLFGSSEIYAIDGDTKRRVYDFSTFDLDALHVVNEADFNAYATQ